MKLKVSFRQECPFHFKFSQEDSVIDTNFGEIHSYTENDYEKLANLPSINGVTLIGNKTSEDLNIAASFPEEGNVGDIMTKTGIAKDAVAWVTPADDAEEDNTRPITSGAVYREIGNINALLATI